MMKKTILLLLFAVCILQFTFSQSIRPFQKGDRVVFTGNSITDGGHYHSYIWLYYMTRFPDRELQIFNAGIGGDAAEQIALRFDDDVVARNPTSVFLTFGMNDSGYYEYLQSDSDSFARERIRISRENYRVIEKKLKALTGVKKILMTSSPY